MTGPAHHQHGAPSISPDELASCGRGSQVMSHPVFRLMRTFADFAISITAVVIVVLLLVAAFPSLPVSITIGDVNSSGGPKPYPYACEWPVSFIEEPWS